MRVCAVSATRKTQWRDGAEPHMPPALKPRRDPYHVIDFELQGSLPRIGIRGGYTYARTTLKDKEPEERHNFSTARRSHRLSDSRATLQGPLKNSVWVAPSPGKPHVQRLTLTDGALPPQQGSRRHHLRRLQGQRHLDLQLNATTSSTGINTLPIRSYALTPTATHAT